MFQDLAVWIESYRTPIITVMSAVIGVAALVFSSLQVLELIKLANKKNFKEMGKPIAALVVIITVAAAGIVGVIKLVNMFVPDNITSNKFNASSVVHHIDNPPAPVIRVSFADDAYPVSFDNTYADIGHSA